ncbi:hypothetical protein MKX03_029034 [Papaver bracteatum]|nr:hypothetical protein MKX03_029034 [Papaver bracteatum]
MIRTPLKSASKAVRTPARTPELQEHQKVRPLSRREQASNDQVAWECTDEHTILSKNLNNERSTVPYTFDRVFDKNCLTERVYEEGAKDVALSPLTGVNATIFAYGQTSSGKTFTMKGITESAVKDIDDHIRNICTKDFWHEIYNETVMDLLKRDLAPSPWIYPEKGTIVEKLVEEAKDNNHLRLFLKTSTSVKSFVESACRLKEGSHISILLTLMTVIRKLSLHEYCNPAWGNSRTAIICTMSPALSHLEQSRNTLSFASSAKRLKILPVALLEAELHSPEPPSSSLKSLLVDRDMKIQKSQAQSELELERKMQKIKGYWKRSKLGRNTMMRRSTVDPSMLVHEIRKLEPCTRRSSQKIVNQDAKPLRNFFSEIKEMNFASSISEDIKWEENQPQRIGMSVELRGVTIATLESKLRMRNSIDKLMLSPSCNDKLGPSPLRNSTNRMQEMFKNAAEENIRSIRTYVTELRKGCKASVQKQLFVCQVRDQFTQITMSWKLIFREQRDQIIMLWHLCHVSIVHRTQFYLLFRGDPDDQMYMEVELRRLTWLEQKLAEVGNASPALLGDEPASSVSSSIRALKQEREQLAKRATSRLTAQELEMLYIKWDVPAGGKQRRLQLVNKLWTDPHNMQHIKDSAEVITKEMFELNFALPSDKKPWMGWNLISNLLQHL